MQVCKPQHFYSNPKEAPFDFSDKNGVMFKGKHWRLTVVELPVTIAATLTLAAFGLGVAQYIPAKARQNTEINTAKNLMAAYRFPQKRLQC